MGRAEGKTVSFHHVSKVCPGDRDQERTGRTGAEERNTKISCGQFLFPGFPPRAADGLSLEGWISKSSCSQVLTRTAGVTGPLRRRMLEINGLHCARMRESSRPGSCPLPAWSRGAGKNNATHFERLHLQINGRHSITKSYFI